MRDLRVNLVQMEQLKLAIQFWNRIKEMGMQQRQFEV